MNNNIDLNRFFEKTKTEIKLDLNSVDQKIINLSLIINKIPKNINEIYEQLRIITDLKIPTLDQYVTIEQYCKIFLLEIENNLTTEKLEKLGIVKTNLKEIKKILEEDIGFDLDDNDKIIIKEICNNILNLIKLKNNLEEHSKNLLKENYPNFYHIAGTKIAIKMLEIAGSFERLSKMPSSTIQLLGSEKSFFKALKMNKKTPKYGVLYYHELIQNLNKKNKGKMARTIAAKISLALKADISKIIMYPELKDKILKKLEQLK